jgi:hypothetical protein
MKAPHLPRKLKKDLKRWACGGVKPSLRARRWARRASRCIELANLRQVVRRDL